MRRRIRLTLATLTVLLVTATPATAGGLPHGGRHGDSGTHWSLLKVMFATAGFHSIRRAEAADYQLGYVEPFLLDGCIAHPTDGAMGYHWFNHDAIHDTELNLLRPEGLVYAPGTRGGLRLAAVEWIVPRALWEAEGNAEPPDLMGQQLHILNPALGWYILHAWVWMPNPSGVFADWNPRVDCG